MIVLISSVVFLGLGNMAFYEYRVHKSLFKDPKFITPAYTSLELKKRYKNPSL